MVRSLLTTVAVIAALAVNSADAHSKMTLPKPNSEISNSPSGTVDGPTAMPPPSGKSYGTSPEANTEAFLEAFKAQSKYKTVRDLIYANFKPDGSSTKECGFSAMTGTPQSLPDYVEYETGFDSTHLGPCEVWCDDTRVFYNENCAKNYPQKPAKLPYDKAKCAGAKRLQSVWLALHVPAWQAYLSCATLSGSGASSGGSASTPSSGSASSSSSSTTPALMTAAPAPSANDANSSNGSGSSGNSSPSTTAPSPASTPATTTTKPSSSSSKCTPKRFRRH